MAWAWPWILVPISCPAPISIPTVSNKTDSKHHNLRKEDSFNLVNNSNYCKLLKNMVSSYLHKTQSYLNALASQSKKSKQHLSIFPVNILDVSNILVNISPFVPTDQWGFEKLIIQMYGKSSPFLFPNTYI